MSDIKWETTFIEENGQLESITVRATYIGEDGVIRNSSKVISALTIRHADVGINWLINGVKGEIWAEFQEAGLV